MYIRLLFTLPLGVPAALAEKMDWQGEMDGEQHCSCEKISGANSCEGGCGNEDEDRRLVTLVICDTNVHTSDQSFYSLDRKYKFIFIICTVLTLLMFYVLI